MKSVVSFGCVLLLLVGSFTGCGAPKVNMIVDDMIDFEYESAACDLEVRFAAEGEEDDEDFKTLVNMSVGLEGSGLDDDEPLVYFDGTLKYSFSDYDKDSSTAKYYFMFDGDEVKEYYNIDNDGWDYDEEELGFDTGRLEALREPTREFLYQAKVLNKTEKVSDELCYVLSLQPTGQECIEYLDSVARAVGIKSEWKEFKRDFSNLEEAIDQLNININIYVSKENGYLVACDIECVDVDGDELIDALELDDYDELEIKNSYIGITFTDINATEVKIPKKVIKEAEN